MPIPSLRFSFMRIAAVLLVVALGAGAWFLIPRDDGASEAPKKAARDEGERKPRSNDPLVRKMSVSEQAEQVLMLGFEGEAPGAPAVADLAARELGAVLVRAENWPGLDAGKKLTRALAAGEGIPPLIATSQEGGVYRSLPDLPPEERELDIGRKGSRDAARAWAQGAAQALANAGFHLNLFPVADVATLDSPLAGRVFSDDPGDVTTLTKAALEGCESSGIACAPLHFPGLGAASQDTAQGPATVQASLEILSGRDLLPFSEVAREARAMVLSLALYPDFDPVVPGALTPSIATDLLRKDVGFRGVAISDDLESGAVKATFSASEAAVEALAAGVDLVQISSPEDPGAIARAVEAAVEDGEIPKERLLQAAERVVELKRKLGLVD